MDEQIKAGLEQVLRKWVELPEKDVEVVMGFLSDEERPLALVITGPAGGGKSWLGRVLHQMAPELGIFDGHEADWPVAQAVLVDESQRVVLIERDFGMALGLIGGRNFVHIQRFYKGRLQLMREDDLARDVTHVYGRRTMGERLTEGLRSWAEGRAITPAEFARKTGYSYQHAFNVLRGGSEATDDTLGRVTRCYGPEAAMEILAPMDEGSTARVV